PYALRVGGTASGTPPNGWTRYGSIGTYELTISGCDGDSPIAPDAPTGLVPTPGEDSVSLSWTAPVGQGSSPVTGYEVSIDGRTLTTSNTSLVVDGLAPDTSYIVSVVAVSAHGTSLPASRSFRTMATNRVPGVPATFTVKPRVGGATLAWTAPTDVGSSPIIGYDIRVGSSVHRVGSTSRGAVVSNLANARTYAVSIAAVNASGSSAVVSRSFRTPGKPTAPRIGLASAGAKGGAVTATARWGTAAANGSPVTAYRVRATLINSRGQAIRHLWSSRLGPSKRSLVMRLPKGRVQFRVVAINAVGQSALSSASRTVMAR
ncbi:MAG: fibronectin type III domain-containing protein, partial [Myxococcales bacterium]